MENMIIVLITKIMEIIKSIQVCLILWMNFDYKDHGGKKSFPNDENMILVPTTKRMEIIMSIQVCFISQMNFDYKENSGKKSCSCKSKASISCIPMRGT